MEFESLDGYQLLHKNYSGVLREKRLVLGLTQQQVADKAKITYGQYQKFESGERNIRTASFQLACKVIEALDMDLTKFFHGDYIIGEPVYSSPEGLRYKKTGRLINEDVK